MSQSLSSNNPTDFPDRGPLVFAVTTTTLALSTIFVFSRIVCRGLIVKRVSRDDWLIVAAWVIAFGLSLTIDFAAKNGLGRHDANIEPQHWYSLRRCEYAFSVLYNPALMATKSSILVFYLRLAKNTQRVLRTVSWATLFVVNTAGIVLTCLNVFQCRPISAAWSVAGGGGGGIGDDPSASAARCIPILTEFICSAPINIVTDLAILALPIPVLTGMRLPSKQKTILVFTFALGIFVTVVDVVRIYYLQQAVTATPTGGLSSDPNARFGGPAEFSWNASFSFMWSAVEVNVGMMCACIPTLKPLILKLLPILLMDPNGTVTTARDNNTTSSSEKDHHLESPTGGTAAAAAADAAASPSPAVARIRSGGRGSGSGGAASPRLAAASTAAHGHGNPDDDNDNDDDDDDRDHYHHYHHHHHLHLPHHHHNHHNRHPENRTRQRRDQNHVHHHQGHDRDDNHNHHDNHDHNHDHNDHSPAGNEPAMSAFEFLNSSPPTTTPDSESHSQGRRYAEDRYLTAAPPPAPASSAAASALRPPAPRSPAPRSPSPSGLFRALGNKNRRQAQDESRRESIRENAIYFGFVNLRRPKSMLTMSGRESFRYCTTVTILFLLWGMSYGLLNILNNVVASISDMTRAETLGLTAIYFGGGYFFGPLLVGEWILRRDEHFRIRRKKGAGVDSVGGFKATFIVGLCIYGIGTIIFWPSAVTGSYGGFMLSNFVVGFGVSILETGGNAFLVLCGPPEYGETRALLAQGVQSVGAVVSEVMARKAFFRGIGGSTSGESTRLINVQWTYLAITLSCVGLALFFYYMPLPETCDAELEEASFRRDVNPQKRSFAGLQLRTWNLVLAVVAQYTYVAAQETCGIFFQSLVLSMVPGYAARGEDSLTIATDTEDYDNPAALRLAITDYLILAHTGFAVSRFLVGGLTYLSASRPRFPQPRTLLTVSSVMSTCCALAIVLIPRHEGANPNLIALPLILFYFSQGPIWPLIYGIGLRGQGGRTKRATAFITMSGSGPAFAPFIMYAIVMAGGTVQISFLVILALQFLTIAYPIFLDSVRDARLLVDPRATALWREGQDPAGPAGAGAAPGDLANGASSPPPSSGVSRHDGAVAAQPLPRVVVEGAAGYSDGEGEGEMRQQQQQPRPTDDVPAAARARERWRDEKRGRMDRMAQTMAAGMSAKLGSVGAGKTVA